MEPTMTNPKALSTAAVLTLLVLPMATPAASFAQNPNGGRPVAGNFVRSGGAPARFSRAGAPRFFNGGGVRANMGAPVAQANGGNWRGNQGWRGNEGWRGDHRRDRDGGFVPGVVVGGVIVSQSYGYYGGPGVYYAPGYSDDQYDDNAAAAVAPAPVADDAATYCIQNYSSYDPASGTYLGNDGYRHSCP
jgi:hypothetical protein